MQKLEEQLQLLRQATPLLRQRAEQLANKEASDVRMQLAEVLDQQTDLFEHSMQACPSLLLQKLHSAIMFARRVQGICDKQSGWILH
jgi:hypothetical protein